MKLPSNFSRTEQCQALAILEAAAHTGSTYGGNWTAPWLVSDIHSETWRIRKGPETRVVGGRLVDAYEFHWDALLPDGSLLTAPRNKAFLAGLQKLGFLARVIPGGVGAFRTHRGYLEHLKLVARWVYLHEDVLDPAHAMLTRITSEALEDYFVAFAEGGAAFLLEYPRRFLRAVYPKALGRPPRPDELRDVFAIRDDIRGEIGGWIESQSYLRKGTREDRVRHVDRAAVARLIGADYISISANRRFGAFLDGFVPETAAAESAGIGIMRRPIGHRRECSTQRDLTLSESRVLKVSEGSVQREVTQWRTTFGLHRHLPEFVPHPDHFRPREIVRLVSTATRPRAHTPWVPLTIALAYTDEALRWVHVYGEELVSVFLTTYRALHRAGLLGPAGSHARAALWRRRRDSFVANQSLPAALRQLKISTWGFYSNIDGKKAYEKLRDAPSMTDAITVLLGAICIVVATLKPMRSLELQNLQRGCLRFVDGDGYWLATDLRKKIVEDVCAQGARPIPAIAAQAITLLRQLGDGLKEILRVRDRFLLDHLFALPSFDERASPMISRVFRKDDLSIVIDTFCDYVALPPDDRGRRWYLRPHELRKSFLITFFWTYRYASLDAARWMAGHADASELYAYLEANFPGEELPGLEAEYASQVLHECPAIQGTDELEGVEELRRQVCRHFGVADLSWIQEETLLDWLEEQFTTGQFEIRPYSIGLADGTSCTRIAFRVRRRSGRRNA